MRYAHAFAAAALCLVTVVPLLAQDDLPQWPERELEFEKSDEAIGHPQEFATARYAASFAATGVNGFDRLTMDIPVDNWLLETLLSEQLSEEQRTLLRRADVVLQLGPDPRFWQGGSADVQFEVRVYAVTEEDARVMVRAVIEWLERNRRRGFETRRDDALATIEKLAEERRSLDEYLCEHPAPAEALKAVRKIVWYKSVEEAQEDVPVLEKAMRAVDVDIAGITAKTTSIENYLKDDAVASRPGVTSMLDQLLIQQDIEMAGAVARKEALESHLQRARDFLQAVVVNKHYRRLSGQVHVSEEYIERVRNELETPGGTLRPLEVLGPVTIQPVEYPDE